MMTIPAASCRTRCCDAPRLCRGRKPTASDATNATDAICGILELLVAQGCDHMASSSHLNVSAEGAARKVARNSRSLEKNNNNNCGKTNTLRRDGRGSAQQQ